MSARIARLLACLLPSLAISVSPPLANESTASCRVIATTTAASDSGIDGVGSRISAKVTIQTICGDADAPSPAAGGGSGGVTLCDTAPRGPLAEVARVWRQVNQAKTPNPKDPTYIEDEVNPAGPSRTVETAWYRIDGDDVQVKYLIDCPGQDPIERWVTVVPDDSGNLVPEVNAIDLVAALHEKVVRQLPTPQLRVFPADTDPDGYTFVQHPTFFWTDQSAGQWDTVSGSTSAGGITVTVQAIPERLAIDPGDGSDLMICQGPQPAINLDNWDLYGDAACTYTYRHSSATATNGFSFPVVATIVWHASWSASTGEGGDLGYISTTGQVRELPVAEVQAIITDG